MLKDKIFIVDDDESIRRSLQRFLSAFDFEIIVFASGEDFLKGVSSETSGCLILDIFMHGMDGLEVQRRLKAMGSHLPIIFITANKDTEMEARAMKAGAAFFLHKPFTEQVLIDSIKKVFRRK